MTAEGPPEIPKKAQIAQLREFGYEPNNPVDETTRARLNLDLSDTPPPIVPDGSVAIEPLSNSVKPMAVDNTAKEPPYDWQENDPDLANDKP